jgi:hypothetical protein
MAKLTYRLPGKPQYSYVEVETTFEEANEPDFIDKLKAALEDLNEVLPTSGGGNSSGGSQQASGGQQNLPAFAHCKHGDMKYNEGGTGRRAWKAYFCSEGKDSPDKCQPVDATTGKEWPKR